jgi:hypothetical protein
MNSLDIKWIVYTVELLKAADGMNAMICNNAISEKNYHHRTIWLIELLSACKKW